jgi:enoyl-CoA hydratase/carnithine racemase
VAELVLCSVENGLCTLTLNRPEKLNALSVEAFRQMAAHLDGLKPEEVGCLLLTGAGRSFCAGHDLDDLASGAEIAGEVAHFETSLVERLATLPCPVVGAVRGHCYTGGLELVLACDIIIAAESAKFADTHAKWDLVPVWGLTQRLPRRIGEAKAKEMMFASRTYSGREAEAMGLANFCVPDEAFEAEVQRFCSDVLGNSARSNREMKKLIRESEGLTLAAGIAWELHRFPGHGPDFEARLAKLR